MKKLEKTCNLSVLFDIFRDRLYPPFDFQMIYARGSNHWKATRESLEPPPTEYRLQIRKYLVLPSFEILFYRKH